MAQKEDLIRKMMMMMEDVALNAVEQKMMESSVAQMMKDSVARKILKNWLKSDFFEEKERAGLREPAFETCRL